jgi:DNA-binding beta-propeller fold protein YncE
MTAPSRQLALVALLLAAFGWPSEGQAQTPTVVASWGPDGQVLEPWGIALSPGGDLVYVLDFGNERVEYFSSSGDFVNQWGQMGSGVGQFGVPRGIAADSVGNVYVADTGNARVQVFSSTGTYISQFGSYGFNDGQFVNPWAVTIGTDGVVYVADRDLDLVSKFTRTGDYLGRWPLQASSQPGGIAFAAGLIYVTDSAHGTVEVFDAEGHFIRQIGSPGLGTGQLLGPQGVAIDLVRGAVYVADTGNHRVEAFTLDGRYIIDWGGGTLGQPLAIAADGSGDIYVADLALRSGHVIKYSFATPTQVSTWGRVKTRYR